MIRLVYNHTKTVGFISAISAALVGITLAFRYRVWKQKSLTSNLMEALNGPSVRMRDREAVERMIRNIIQGGRHGLQVIADFDRTLSRHKNDDGKVCDTCHNALDMSSHLPEFYRTEATQLRDVYMKIEFDSDKTIEEKYPYMVEWWTKAHNLLVQCNLTRNILTQIVAESNILLRTGCDHMFKELNKADIPLLIFSAGIGDVIEEVIKQQVKLYENMKIVSNYMDFNSQGTLVGFQGDVIHTFNKNENSVHKSDYFEKLRHRSNVILLGDSLGDLRMAEGCSADSNVLKIGFLNDRVDELLPSYMDAFDVVLVKDETMDVPNAILKQVL